MYTETHILTRYTHLCIALSSYIIAHDSWGSDEAELAFMNLNWQLGSVALELGIDVTHYMAA